MKTRIFSKDECAPDAISAKQFLSEKFGKSYFKIILDVGFIRNDFGDGSSVLFLHEGVYYLIEYSCGVYEDVYTLDKEDVAIEFIKHCAETLDIQLEIKK